MIGLSGRIGTPDSLRDDNMGEERGGGQVKYIWIYLCIYYIHYSYNESLNFVSFQVRDEYRTDYECRPGWIRNDHEAKVGKLPDFC